MKFHSRFFVSLVLIAGSVLFFTPQSAYAGIGAQINEGGETPGKVVQKTAHSEFETTWHPRNKFEKSNRSMLDKPLLTLLLGSE